MFNSIFGALGQASLTGQGIYQSNSQALQNTYAQQQVIRQLAQAQAQMYNQALQAPRWMINGQRFTSAEEFARHIWPDDEHARLMFCLKYPG